MKNFLVLVLVLISGRAEIFAQYDSIYDQGMYRTYIVHLPSGYSPDNSYPIVLNLHGYNNTAAIQQSYSQFDAVADAEELIVIYPNAIGGSWDVAGNSDVAFLMNLVDTIREKYSANYCLFSMGMSRGGFMTYKLGCTVADELTAISVVAGNMDGYLQATSTVVTGLPVMHFHGTADLVVNIDGAFGIPPVDTTISWWVNENNCMPEPHVFDMPDLNTSDNSTVIRGTWPNGTNGSKVIYYRINNGGHTWPGAFPVAILGNTNQDISASELSAEFFKSYCPGISGLQEANYDFASVFVNPVEETIAFTNQSAAELFNISIYDGSGRKVKSADYFPSSGSIDISEWNSGLYILKITNSVGLNQTIKFIKP